MASPNFPYVALRTISLNNVRAYNPGDLVPESAVVGPDAWLALGVDVELRNAGKDIEKAKGGQAPQDRKESK